MKNKKIILTSLAYLVFFLGLYISLHNQDSKIHKDEANQIVKIAEEYLQRYIAVYVDKNTNKVIGGTQTK